MNLKQTFSSKNVLVFNLVLIGVIFGFSLAFLSFSCSTPGAAGAAGGKTALAEENAAAVPANSLAVAEGLQGAFRSVAGKVLPSVVELQTTTVRKQQVPNFNGIPWEFFFGPRDGGQDPRGQEREYKSQGLGSGIIVRKTGGKYYILTNNHVVEDSSEIVALTNNGTEYPAKLVGTDARRDLALVSVETGDDLPLATLGDSDEVQVGDWAIAVGNPLGFMSSVTMGIISAVGRTGGPAGNINDFLQTDASINQGNSGGALVNIKGEVIGINTWIASNSSGGGSVGIGFAIPINNAKRSIDEFISSGSIKSGWLGVSLTDPGKETLAALGVDGKRGALAAQVFGGSPADKGGIQPGDFITAVNGREVRGVNQLTMMVGDLRPGDKAAFKLIRDNKEIELTVKIEERTDKVASDNKKLWPGAYVMPLTDSVRENLKLDKNAEGLYVAQVITESPAAIVGLQEGDRITGINGEKVKTIADFYRALREKAGKELQFQIIRGEHNLDTLKFKR